MAPRIQPLTLDAADQPTRELLARLSPLRGLDTRVLNVFGTLAHHPALLRHWLGFATYLLTESTLEPRLRELCVLRVGWRCASPYEWGQHVIVGRKVGVTDADLQRLTLEPQSAGWSAAESAALCAVDELIDRHTLGDPRWRALTEHFATQQILDLVFLVGQYQLVSSALNACRIERDDGLDERHLPFPSRAE
jgi:alkylhydroperoxidase family enzyme